MKYTLKRFNNIIQSIPYYRYTSKSILCIETLKIIIRNKRKLYLISEIYDCIPHIEKCFNNKKRKLSTILINAGIIIN